MRALDIAATGMNAQALNVEVIANNIANINTTGFKRARAEFTDLLYQAERLAGVPNRGGQNTIPEGAQLGLGVRPAAIRELHLQGALAQTSNRFDVALNGRGWFRIQGAGGETLYTRAGAFNTNATGQIVTIDGYVVDPAITVPADVVEVMINQTGEVMVRFEDQTEMETLGQISLATFVNEPGLQPMGGNLYRETPASGAAVIGVPGDPGFGSVFQGYLEASNVDPVKEITELIAAQRAYEMNSKVIQTADDMAGVITQGIR